MMEKECKLIAAFHCASFGPSGDEHLYEHCFSPKHDDSIVLRLVVKVELLCGQVSRTCTFASSRYKINSDFPLIFLIDNTVHVERSSGKECHHCQQIEPEV